MRQLKLHSAKPKKAGESAMEDLLEALQQAVANLGLKEVTFELDVAKSTLSEALGGKTERRWAQEWTCVVLAMLSQKHSEACDVIARAILKAQADLTYYWDVTEHDDITPEDLAAAKRLIASAERRKARAR